MQISIAGEAKMEAFGEALASALRVPATVYLQGDLGAGKTTLTRGLLRGAGHQGAVKSPTYALLETYDLPGMQVIHADLYRLADPQELEYLGLELDATTLLIVEWPQQGEGYLPEADLLVQIEHAQNARQISVSGALAQTQSVSDILSEFTQ